MPTALELGIPRLCYYDSYNPKHLRNTLGNNRIHFSDPSGFNDPWDCSPKYVMDEIITHDGVNAWAEFLLRDASNVLSAEQIAKLKTFSAAQQIAFLETTLKEMTRHSREITTSRWRIRCLSPDPELILMWAHYGNKHSGVCLEFDARIPPFANACKVRYEKTRPLISWQMLSDEARLTEAILLTKSIDWSYEQEFRILCRNGELDSDPMRTLCKTTENFLEIPPEAITRVIVGNRGDLAGVQQVVSEFRPDLEVQQATLAEKEYKIIVPQTSHI